MATWIPSPNFYEGRRRPLAFVVFHSTENSERTGMARNVARTWFALPSSKVSAHVVVDAAEVVECVKPQNTAWHCASGNADGYGVELVGRTEQTPGEWRDAYSLAAIRHACAWIRSTPALAGIPARWLTDDQLRRRERGLTTHLQVARVLGGTDHRDPGPGFPKDYVLQQLTGSSAAATPRALRKEDRGPDVYALQERLRARFPDLVSWSPSTEYFGALTDAAVRAAQKRLGLAADGIVGPATRARLGL